MGKINGPIPGAERVREQADKAKARGLNASTAATRRIRLIIVPTATYYLLGAAALSVARLLACVTMSRCRYSLSRVTLLLAGRASAMQPLPDYTALRKRLPDHKIPIRDHYGFELQTHAGIARKRMEALEDVKIPQNWTSPVLHQTRSALRAARHSSLAPDLSYDLDGDGFVSPQDYQLAMKFDPSRSGRLTGDARQSAIAEGYRSLGGMLRDDEVGGNRSARAVMAGLNAPPQLDDTHRYYQLREANMTITNLKNK